MRHAALLLALAMTVSCSTEYEGDEPGECEDDADNDRDGLFDCLDPSCAGARACMTTSPTTPDPDPEPDPTPDPEPDPEDTFGPTVISGDRIPGPNEDEYRLVSAWEQLEETVDSQYGPACTNITDPDWEGVFEPPEYTGEYVYVFYRVQSGGTSALGQNCANGFPNGCVDNDIVYLVEDHTLTGSLPRQDIPVENVAGCTITLETDAIVEDMGDSGSLLLDITITATQSCPAELLINNGCRFSHGYDLVWVRAE